jgi:hypothetical protein
MFTSSINQSNVDIDAYFDSLDFDVFDLDMTANLIKPKGSERRFQLPEPTYQPANLDIKQPLDQIALEQATYEVRLLARQLENTPFNIVEPLEEGYDAPPSPRSNDRTKGHRLSVVVVGVLLASLSVYVHYSKCATATSCAQRAKEQLVGQLVKRFGDRPHRVDMSSPINYTSLAIAPTADPFRTAVNQAMRAAELTQTATSANDWETVANTWLEAIRLMNITPATNPRYSTAALKVEEYAKNLAYAQRRMREATKSSTTF